MKYRHMNPFLAVGIAEGFEPANSEDERVRAWQYLVDHDMTRSLQGWFGRQARALIDAGVIHEKVR